VSAPLVQGIRGTKDFEKKLTMTIASEYLNDKSGQEHRGRELIRR
jgi:hypothetical protein